MKSSRDASPTISNDAVREATGRGWAEWFQLLDMAAAAGRTHKEIVALVRGISNPGRWWEQMITVMYEQDRGLRHKHQRTDGYQISATRTIDAPIASAWDSWIQPRRRTRWLVGNISIRGDAERRSLRFGWDSGGNCIVTFTERSADRCTVTVEHSRLGTAAQAEEMKLFWRDALMKLKNVLDTK